MSYYVISNQINIDFLFKKVRYVKKILLVEDEALIAMNEAQMLKKHGYEVVTAHNGEKAIEGGRA
ncbi:MAG: hypothetical protein U5P10_13620 [Spirochaetia bacterium]|nr:hypothetical protein [Spirochaetia bacterium]